MNSIHSRFFHPGEFASPKQANPFPQTCDLIHLSVLQEYVTGPVSILDCSSRNHWLLRTRYKQCFTIYARKNPTRFPLLHNLCPLCQCELDSIQFNTTEEQDFGLDQDNHPGFDGSEEVAAFEYCRRCRYWAWHYLDAFIEQRGGVWTHDYTGLISKARMFEPQLPNNSSAELALWIRRHPDAWRLMSPRRFELLVADIFRANYSHAEVVHVGQTGDKGIDAVLTDTGDKQWLIQVKRRAKFGRSESPEAVDRLIAVVTVPPAKTGSVELVNVVKGILVSNADHFTVQAIERSNDARKKGHVIELIDRGLLDKMLGATLPDRPWLPILRATFPRFANRLETMIPSDCQLVLPITEQW